ncbi:glycosyltransferase [Ottowia thiooxydans]|uniref:Glycosyltransferase 2-like domain-containing protein n=1 Tax=Ottowia thiooxydans TaxID=219182 RepID=A0ABV2QE27_9BURK
MMTDFYEDEEVQRAFFQEMGEGYQQAAAMHQSITRIVLAGICIELRFASEKLKQIFLPALGHLCVESAEGCKPAHTLCLWDRSSSAIGAPPPPCDRRHFTDRGDIWGFNNKVFQFAFLYGELSVNMYSRSERLGYYWVDEPEHLPYWCAAAPLRSLLHWCMSEEDRQLLHGAAIGTSEGAILLTGSGGIGKSSTALNGLQEGMHFSGDDYVVLALEPEPTVYPLYASAKVNRDQLSFYERLRPCLTNPEGGENEKAIFELIPTFADQIPASMPVRAILVPKVHDAPQSVIENTISRHEVKHAASLTTVEQLPYAGNDTYQFIDRLCASVPSFRLKLGSDRKRLIEYLRSWLNEGRNHIGPAPVDEAAAPTPLTVIIPAFNREHLIDDAISNVLAQQYPDLELIVVDDGSTDATAARARSHPEVKLFQHPNSGPAQSRNRGIVNARGDYIAFLDSDDLWPSDMLRELVNTLDKHPEVDVVMGWPQLARFTHGSETGDFYGNPREGFDAYITGTVFRRQAFERVGLFDADLTFGEDVDWFTRARELQVHILRVDYASVIVRRHTGNMTKGKNLVELNVLRVFKKALDRKRDAAKIH